MTVNPSSLIARSATARVSAACLSSHLCAGPRYTDQRDGWCTQDGVPWCICPGSMATRVPCWVCTGIPPTYPGGLYSQHDSLSPYTPREAILGHIHHRTHPGRLYWTIYPTYTHPGRLYWAIYRHIHTQGGYTGPYTPVYTPGRLYWAIYTVIHTLGERDNEAKSTPCSPLG